MVLADLRKLIADTTGRFDLVDDSYNDRGLDFFIKAGQRWLDSKFPAAGSLMHALYNVNSGENVVKVKGCKFIKEVWCSNVESTWLLRKGDQALLKKLYGKQDLSQVTGTPTYYAEVSLGLSPPLNSLYDSSSHPSWYGDDLVMYSDEGNHFEYSAILIYPTPTEKITLDVMGSFDYEFVNDNSETFWSSKYPELCVLATEWAIETLYYRNTLGATNIESQVNRIINELYNDLVESEIAQVTREDSYEN